MTAPGEFISAMTGLMPGTVYFVRGYATNAAGTAYGEEVSFQTLQLPAVTTQAVTDIGTDTATGNGTITELGSPGATRLGFCWNTFGLPTVDDARVETAALAKQRALQCQPDGAFSLYGLLCACLRRQFGRHGLWGGGVFSHETVRTGGDDPGRD